jgi:nucleotide-binding universal stress UspA family protein
VGSVAARVIGHTQRDAGGAGRNDAGVEKISGYRRIEVQRHRDQQGCRFCKACGSLVVLSVVDVPTEFYAEAPKAVEDMIRTAREYTAAVKKQAEAEGVSAESFVGEAEAWEAVVKLAQDQNVDMIVVGSHGRTGLRRLLMGSVTEKVIGHAPCPVLVVKS